MENVCKEKPFGTATGRSSQEDVMKASDAVKLLQEFASCSSDDQDNGKLSWNMWAK